VIEVALDYGMGVSWQQVPHWLRYAGHPLTGMTEELHAAIDHSRHMIPGPSSHPTVTV
jgi:hypothetical protein